MWEMQDSCNGSAKVTIGMENEARWAVGDTLREREPLFLSPVEALLRLSTEREESRADYLWGGIRGKDGIVGKMKLEALPFEPSTARVPFTWPEGLSSLFTVNPFLDIVKRIAARKKESSSYSADDEEANLERGGTPDSNRWSIVGTINEHVDPLLGREFRGSLGESDRFPARTLPPWADLAGRREQRLARNRAAER
ncbi:hypothetical protein KM043_006095 [Ampulex compressa]|nr:hypothetical protein KM043_006095 [Ampulex compressa]